MITQSELKELLEYNPDTGIFTRKTSKGGVKIGSIVGSKRYDDYIQISLQYKKYPAHRLAWLYINGKEPRNHIDHINGNRSDNRICNLREATNQENIFNSKLSKANTSGIKGVTWDKQKKKWVAQIMLNYKTIKIGRFKNIEDAKDSVIKFRESLHKEFANHGNH